MRRVPLPVLFAFLILPPVVFGTWCRRMMPGEVLRPAETIPRAAGYPVALVLAVASFRGSSAGRRVGLVIVIVIAIVGLAAASTDLAQYWWTGPGKSPYE